MSRSGESLRHGIEVGLLQGSALSPHIFLILKDVCTEKLRKDALNSTQIKNRIVLC